MTTIYMIRHGRAAASFTDDTDPGLDETGRKQAISTCEWLADKAPLQILSSPLKRAMETAMPLVRQLETDMQIEERVSEIPSPGLSLQERGPWLRAIMQGNWSDQSADLQQWRADMVDCLLNLEQDTAIFSHFVAINALVAAARDSDNILQFRPDNGSVTIFRTTGGILELVSSGEEAATRVN